MPPRRILVIDDEENIGRSLRMILEREGYQVNAVHSAAQMRAFPEKGRIDLFLLDVRLPDANGIDLLRELQDAEITAPVVMISGHATIADAVTATRAGAFDFLEKPLGRDRVMVAVKNALEQGTLRKENKRLREVVGPGTRMIGRSAAFQRALEQATMAARSDARVLLIGESGTGKELLAAHIHAASPFAAGPFVKVNCAAIPGDLIESELFGHEKGSFTGATSLRRGKFEMADNGTLFLDEIGDLHANSQAKLLRVLQEGEFHRVGGEQVIRATVRVISATNRDLTAMVSQGKFREDLYYRVSVVPLRVPALRERPQDIRPMAEYFLEDFCGRNGFRQKSFDAEVWAAFEDWKWPGNARELRNAVERMAILSHGDLITAAAIPLELRLPQNLSGTRTSVQEARESGEREHVLRALEDAGWNVSGAARALGIERTNLHKRIKALGLTRGK